MKNKRFESALSFSQKAGRLLLGSFRSQPPKERGTSKEVTSPLDREADNLIIEAIEDGFPEDSYLTEETGLVDKKSSFLWVVDPLDGTGNFLNHNPFFSVSVALFEKNRPVFGIVEAPFLRERFWVKRGEDAWRQDLLKDKKEKLVVSSLEDKDSAYIAYCEGGERDKKRITDIFSTLYRETKEVRKVGSAALELCFVACGRVDGYYTTKIRLWDVAAGIMIARRAGAEISFFGEKFSWKKALKRGDFDLTATNGLIALNLSRF